MASDNSSQRDEQKDGVEAPAPTNGTNVSEAESNNDSLASSATTSVLTPSSSSDGYVIPKGMITSSDLVELTIKQVLYYLPIANDASPPRRRCAEMARGPGRPAHWSLRTAWSFTSKWETASTSHERGPGTTHH